MRVLYSGALNDVTGYGADGYGLCQSLIRWGCDVYVQPTNVHPPLPPSIAALLTKAIPDHVDLALTHRCPQELAFPASSGPRTTATVSLAWSMWEYASLDNVDHISSNNCEHQPRVTDRLSSGLASYDALLAYDEVSHGALSPYHKDTRILQGGVDTPPRWERDWFGSPFRFLMLGALHNRKNPMAVVTAFKELRDAGELADAELILKTVVPGFAPQLQDWCPGLTVITEVWTPQRVDRLMSSCHALLAPSRGEGKNIPAVRFAASGGAVAATSVGGHNQWLSSEIGFPLRWEWRDSVDGRGAEVDHGHLREVMVALYRDREEARRRAECAAAALPAMVGWDRVLERLAAILGGTERPLAGSRGAEVAALMARARRGRPKATPQD